MNFHKLFAVYILSGNLLDILTRAEPIKGADIKKVDEGKYPFVVSIAQRNNLLHEEDSHICTGVLISKQFVLTAAHCFEEHLLGEIYLKVGSVDLRKGKRYYPSMWITYNQWAESKNITKESNVNDIAIIKLSYAVSTRIAKPASLSSFKKSSDLYSAHVVLVGWGATNDSPESTSRYLLETRVKVLPNGHCKNILCDLLKMKVLVPDKYICSKGEPQAYLDYGDSGGPVLSKNYVIAISGGVCPKEGTCNLPTDVIQKHQFNFHTIIHFYKNFIDDVLKND